MDGLVFEIIIFYLLVSGLIYLVMLLLELDVDLDTFEAIGFCFLWIIFIPMFLLFCSLKALIRVFMIFSEKEKEKENE